MDYILDNVGVWKDRLVNNSMASFEEMTAQRWIRIILIVCAYLLVRPWLLKGAENRQKRLMAQDAADLGLDGGDGPNANDIRGRKAPKGGAKSTGVDTGRK